MDPVFEIVTELPEPLFDAVVLGVVVENGSARTETVAAVYNAPTGDAGAAFRSRVDRAFDRLLEAGSVRALPCPAASGTFALVDPLR